MKTSRWLLYPFCLPWALTMSYPGVYLMVLLRLAKNPEWKSFGVLVATWSDWVCSWWRYSTTMGSAVIFNKEHRGVRQIEQHEGVHVRQYEDNCFIGFLIAALHVFVFHGHWAAGLFIWWSAGSWQLISYLTAGFRWGFGQRTMYYGAEHERAAYAETVSVGDGKLWEDTYGVK